MSKKITKKAVTKRKIAHQTLQHGPDGRFQKRVTSDERRATPNALSGLSAASREQFTALIAEITSLAAADAEVDTSLAIMFGKYPRIKAAWEKAIAQRVEEVLKNKFAEPIQTQSDYRNITLHQLSEITGKTERCIYDWLRKGLARNADGTFNLPTFIVWFERYTISKLPPQVVATVNTPHAELQKRKAEQLQRDLDLGAHHILNREEVMAGIISRHQNLINSFDSRAEGLAMLCNGQPQAESMKILRNFFDEVLKQQCQVPEFLCLMEETEKQFTELLKSLKPEKI